MPEEVKLLIESEVAYIVDDFAWHKEKFNTFQGEERAQYLNSLRSEGLKARTAAEASSQTKKKNALARLAARKPKDKPSEWVAIKDTTDDDDTSELLFDIERPESSTPSSLSTLNTEPYAITPTTTYSPLSLPQNSTPQPDPPFPSSYHLFKHLHSKNYFVLPGLRFGCDYNVYPGDPLRFHSHFAAVSYEWNEEIPMIDLVGGGRLGTRVKKGFLIGGKNSDSMAVDGDGVRTFSIEWAGM
jgi:tRNA-splicing endonuclease subunit Sen34